MAYCVICGSNIRLTKKTPDNPNRRRCKNCAEDAPYELFCYETGLELKSKISLLPAKSVIELLGGIKY